MGYYEKSGWRRIVEPDMLLALSAVFMSVCALGVSIVQVRIMGAEQRANAWPRIEAMVNTGSAFSLQLTNKGFGPALVQTVVVTVDSIPVRTWDEALRMLVPGTDSITKTQAKITDVVLSPQSQSQIFRVAEGSASNAVSAQTHRLGMEICFCSIYNDCWWLQRASFGSGSRWSYRETSSCSTDDPRRFQM